MVRSTEAERSAICDAVIAEIQHPSNVELRLFMDFWDKIAHTLRAPPHKMDKTGDQCRAKYEQCRKSGREGLIDTRSSVSKRVRQSRRRIARRAELAQCDAAQLQRASERGRSEKEDPEIDPNAEEDDEVEADVMEEQVTEEARGDESEDASKVTLPPRTR